MIIKSYQDITYINTKRFDYYKLGITKVKLSDNLFKHELYFVGYKEGEISAEILLDGRIDKDEINIIRRNIQDAIESKKIKVITDEYYE